MTKKENFLSILHYSKYFGLIFATVLVAIFQFKTDPMLIKISLSFYSVSFMILAIIEFFKFADLVSQSKHAEKKPAKIESSDEQDKIAEEKKQERMVKFSKVMSMIMGILYSIMAIFTLVVFILY